LNTRKPAKILFCEHNVDGTVGGSYYSLLYLAKGLDRSRFKPVVVFYAPHALLPAFHESGIDTEIWSAPAAFTFGRLKGWRQWVGLPIVAGQKVLNVVNRLFRPALVRARYIRANGIALVHLNNSVLFNHDWMLAARLAGVPCVTHERGINERYTAASRYFGRKLGAIICISEAVKRQMQERDADFGNLVTIHNGLDPAAIKITVPGEELRRQYGLAPDTIVVGMVGNIRAWKGQDTVVRAIDQLRQAAPNVCCMFVGDTSPMDRGFGEELRRLIAARGLERHVVFTGYQRHPADFQMMFDVVVHASVTPEPFGRVVLEAMACKKPFIGSRAGAIPEIVEEGRTGLTFPPGDHEALAAAIARVIGDREEAGRMGERGYERLVSQFHIDRNTAATEEVYARLLSATD
jgi:glycosyltransferase involved in cell wall biosynthesis